MGSSNWFLKGLSKGKSTDEKLEDEKLEDEKLEDEKYDEMSSRMKELEPIEKPKEKSIDIERIISLIKEGELRYAERELEEVSIHKIEKVIHLLLKELNKELTEIQSDEFVWVEGYKGTNYDMTCLKYQFEMNEIHTIEGDIIECKNGFHLCSNLSDVMGYYDIDDIPKRYFKVMALVRKSDFYKIQNKTYKITAHSGYGRKFNISINTERSNKIVSKSIVFIEEIGFDEIKQFFPIQLSFINKDIWSEIIKKRSVLMWYKEKTIIELQKKGMSEILANVIIDRRIKETYSINEQRRRGSNSFSLHVYDRFENLSAIDDFKNKFVGLVDSGTSIDMCMYLLREYM